jgi:acetolactate synthase regulatory subunit
MGKKSNKAHTLTALLSNEPGVLSRVSGTLAGRGYNIDSLVVCTTEVPDISRATIVIHENSSHKISHIKRDLEDIVQVTPALCSLLSSLFSLLSSLCSLLSVLCSLLSALCSLPSARFSLLLTCSINCPHHTA